MLPRTRAYIFSVLIFCVVSANAQDATPVDSAASQSPSRFIPTGVRIGYDLMALGKSQFTDRFDGWEVAADVDFDRYYFVLEYGGWSVEDPLRNGTYTNDGNYYRVGIDVNFLKNDPEKNMFFLGGRLGHSSYSDRVTYRDTVPPFPPIGSTVENPLVIATWVELTSGIKVKVWKFLWLGATARFKFGLDLDGNGPLRSYDVPGFGRNISQVMWGFSYYLLVRIPFKKE